MVKVLYAWIVGKTQIGVASSSSTSLRAKPEAATEPFYRFVLKQKAVHQREHEHPVRVLSFPRTAVVQQITRMQIERRDRNCAERSSSTRASLDEPQIMIPK